MTFPSTSSILAVSSAFATTSDHMLISGPGPTSAHAPCQDAEGKRTNSERSRGSMSATRGVRLGCNFLILLRNVGLHCSVKDDILEVGENDNLATVHCSSLLLKVVSPCN
jgi:hypothetical protein